MPDDSRRGVRGVAVLSGMLVAGAAVALVRGRRRFRREIVEYADELLADAEPPERRQFDDAALEDLPAPVRRYFETVLGDGQPSIRSARLSQHGEFRLGGPDAPWRPMEATQHVTTRPPGFVWDAEIEVLPGVPVRVVDRYRRGEGVLRGRLLSAIPVASAGPGPGMNEAELVRYLSEGVLIPTALLPDRGVEWEPVDDRSARATLEHRGVTASAVFHFDDRGLVDRVTAERYRQEDDACAPWTGHFRNYREHDGVLVPTEAEVGWDGEGSYWRATIEGIEYRVAELPDGRAETGES